MKRSLALIPTALLLAACSDSQPTSNETVTVTPEPVTETVTATPEPSLGHNEQWLLESLETVSSLEGMVEILVAGEVDCPDPDIDDLGIVAQCQSDDHVTMIVRPLNDELDPREMYEDLGTGDAGVVATDKYHIMSTDPGVIDSAARALSLLDPHVEHP